MTNPLYTHIDDIFTDSQSLTEDAISLYSNILNEAPEIQNGWLYVIVFNKDPLNQLALNTSNIYTIFHNTRTYYKSISLGKIYKIKAMYIDDSLPIEQQSSYKDVYWLVLDDNIQNWNLTSNNYKLAEDNNFAYLWYNFSNFKINLTTFLNFVGKNFYSQSLVREDTDIETIDGNIIHDQPNKAFFVFNDNSDANNVLWKLKIDQEYLRIYLQGYKVL